MNDELFLLSVVLHKTVLTTRFIGLDFVLGFFTKQLIIQQTLQLSIKERHKLLIYNAKFSIN